MMRLFHSQRIIFRLPFYDEESPSTSSSQVTSIMIVRIFVLANSRLASVVSTCIARV